MPSCKTLALVFSLRVVGVLSLAETRSVLRHPTAVLSPHAAALERIKALVLDTLPSAESKRAYRQGLDDFFRWCGAEGPDGLTKATVNPYRAHLEARHLSPSAINQRLSAIWKLVTEAADSG